MVLFFYDMLNNISPDNYLYLPAWQGERGCAGSFFKCRMKNADDIPDDHDLFFRLCDRLADLADYYRESGSEYGSEPDITEYGYYGSVPDTWERYIRRFSGLSIDSEEFDHLERGLFGDSDASKYAVFFAQSLCRMRYDGTAGYREQLRLRRELAEAVTLSLYSTAVSEIRRTDAAAGTKGFFQPENDVTRYDMAEITELLERSPQLCHTGLERRLLISVVFSDPEYLKLRLSSTDMETVDKAADTLPCFIKELIRDRFGLDDGRIKQAGELSGKYLMTPAEISESLAHGLRMLRTPNRAKLLRSLL